MSPGFIKKHNPPPMNLSAYLLRKKEAGKMLWLLQNIIMRADTVRKTSVQRIFIF